ncbi:MAG: GAF domain-containing sensor histidine kinase [Actinomycetota bacterium]|nr:GAF domain-containing sensor histidine kinase [Actinomycetota bacterium]
MEAESEAERSRRDYESLLKRQQLFEKLARVQRSISHGAPLDEVLDAITVGANQLIGDGVVALRLIDEDDPSHCVIVSSCGIREDIEVKLRRMPVGQGAGGRAIRENRLVAIHDYETSDAGLEALAKDGLQAAMAAPVHEKGEVAGSLVVASYQPGRVYSELEQEALTSLAHHASLALTDAKAVEALREAQRSKDMFLAMVSHELKSPLTVILGTLHTLRKHHTSVSQETRAEMLESAYERANELAALVNRVLEGARAELAAAEEEVMLADLIRTSLRGFEQARPLFVADIPQVTVKVDPGAVRQVIGILLENAVSHSPVGDRVKIQCDVDETSVTVSVINRGCISEEERAGLFEPFSRGKAARSSGVGLGLYIASRLATAIGGSLSAESRGDSVCFALTFPHRTAVDPAPVGSN